MTFERARSASRVSRCGFRDVDGLIIDKDINYLRFRNDEPSGNDANDRYFRDRALRLD